MIWHKSFSHCDYSPCAVIVHSELTFHAEDVDWRSYKNRDVKSTGKRLLLRPSALSTAASGSLRSCRLRRTELTCLASMQYNWCSRPSYKYVPRRYLRIDHRMLYYLELPLTVGNLVLEDTGWSLPDLLLNVWSVHKLTSSPPVKLTFLVLGKYLSGL